MSDKPANPDPVQLQETGQYIDMIFVYMEDHIKAGRATEHLITNCFYCIEQLFIAALTIELDEVIQTPKIESMREYCRERFELLKHRIGDCTKELSYYADPDLRAVDNLIDDLDFLNDSRHE